MPRGAMVVQSGPVSVDRDDEFNDWLDHTHIPEVLETPGFVGATRYRLVQTVSDGGGGEPPEYLTVYEIEADDVVAARDELVATAADRTTSDALCTDPRPRVFLYERL